MIIKQTSTIINTEGYIDRLEHAPIVRRENVVFQNIKEPIYVARPKIEDFNNLVVVHNKVEEYL